MRSVVRRTAVISGVTSVIVAVGAAVAFASASSGPVNLSTTGVKFVGSYIFYAPGTNRGGFGYPGKVCDTSSDGNAVFVQARDEGYGYGGRFYDHNGHGTCASEDMYVYAGDEVYVIQGQIQTCQDRGTLFSDLCKSSPVYTRPGH